jgi:hypothetical protein
VHCRTEDNIKALAGTVQAAWSACKADADKYKDAEKWLTTNKDAKRRLFSWVWEPESANEEKTAQPKYAPDHYKVKLSEANRHAKLAQHAKQAKLATPVKQRVQLASPLEQQTAHEATMLADAKNKTKGPFKDCLIEATKDPCQKISSCKDPVCNSYYDDPEIEALCGMCTMAPGAGCSLILPRSPFYYFGICIFVCIWTARLLGFVDSKTFRPCEGCFGRRVLASSEHILFVCSKVALSDKWRHTIVSSIIPKRQLALQDEHAKA